MIAVIGDVHGCYNTLKELVVRIRRLYPGISIYCVGDLVDRGNFSFETVEFVINEGLTCTSGNHDFMFYYYITDSDNDIGKSWIFNGAAARTAVIDGSTTAELDDDELIVAVMGRLDETSGFSAKLRAL